MAVLGFGAATGGGGGGGGGVGTDVTPTAFTFGNINADLFGVSATATLADITAPISIKVVRTGTAELFIYKNGNYTSLVSGSSFSAVSGDVIAIAFSNPGPNARTGTYTVTNDSDSNAALGGTPSSYHITFAGTPP